MSPRAVYGIIGFPVSHSRSPAMHNAAFRAIGVNAVYVAFPVPPDKLGDALSGVRALGIRGLNVTLPHKTAVIPLLDEVSDAARAIGAVNTIVNADGRLLGDNTDAPGLSAALQEAGVWPCSQRVTIVGAGGAARAAAVGLGLAGASQLAVVARRRAAAEGLVAEIARACGSASLSAHGMDNLEELFARTDLLVQATSATLAGSAEADAFAASLPVAALPAHAAVTDLVYEPRTTTVLRACQARGLQTVDGLGMLVHQGALAFERWTGQRPPIDVMRGAFEQPAR